MQADSVAPHFFLAHYKLCTRSCELLVAKAGHKLCLLPDIHRHSSSLLASSWSWVAHSELLLGWGVAAFATNSMVKRQTVDLIGEVELRAQRGLQQQRLFSLGRRLDKHLTIGRILEYWAEQPQSQHFLTLQGFKDEEWNSGPEMLKAQSDAKAESEE